MQQKEDDQKRAEAMQQRRGSNEKEEEDIDVVRADRTYMQDRMKNIQDQIKFFEDAKDKVDITIKKAFEDSIGKLNKKLSAVNQQFMDLSSELSNKEFSRFLRTQKDAEQDEAMFKNDKKRAEEEKGELDAQITDLAKKIAAASGQAKKDLEATKTKKVEAKNALVTKISSFATKVSNLKQQRKDAEKSRLEKDE